MHDADSLAATRRVLAPEYASLPPHELAQALDAHLGYGAAEDIEGFLNDLGRVVRRAAPVVQRVLPVATTLAGTALGGPLGGALGGVAGRALSTAISGAPRVPSTSGQRPPRGGSPAAAQLLGVLTRPETLQALLGMVIGAAGRGSVPVAGRSVPAAAFTNLIGQLANQAAAEHHRAFGEGATGTPEYLLDQDGEPLGDAADPRARAEALLGHLAAADLLTDELDEDAFEDDGNLEFETEQSWREDLDDHEDLLDALLEEAS